MFLILETRSIVIVFIFFYIHYKDNHSGRSKFGNSVEINSFIVPGLHNVFHSRSGIKTTSM